MKESSFWRYCLAAVGLVLVAVAAHSMSQNIFDTAPRYVLQSAAQGAFIYKMDVHSGHIWVVHQGFASRLPDTDEDAKKEAAIKRAKAARTLSSSSDPAGTSSNSVREELIKNLIETWDNERLIRSWLEGMDSVTTIDGWSAHRVEDDTYLVECGFKKAGGYGSAWWFEVNLSANTVRYLSLTSNRLANDYYRGIKSSS